MPYWLEPLDERFEDRFRVRHVSYRGNRTRHVLGEVARTEDGRWMALPPGWPYGLPGFRTPTGAARWLEARYFGGIDPPPGFGARSPLLERRKRRRYELDQPAAVLRKQRWRRRKRWERLEAEAGRADPRLSPGEGLRWALAVTAAAAEGRACCSFEREDGRVSEVAVTPEEVRAARAWLAG